MILSIGLTIVWKIARTTWLCDFEMKKYVVVTNLKFGNHILDDIAFSILSKLPLKSFKSIWVHTQILDSLVWKSTFHKHVYQNSFIFNNHSYYDNTYFLLSHSLIPLTSEPFHFTLYILFYDRFENMVKLAWPPPFHKDESCIYILSLVSVNETLCLAQTRYGSVPNMCILESYYKGIQGHSKYPFQVSIIMYSDFS